MFGLEASDISIVVEGIKIKSTIRGWVHLFMNINKMFKPYNFHSTIYQARIDYK